MKKVAIISLCLGIMILIISFNRQAVPDDEISRIAREYTTYEVADSEYLYTIALCEAYHSGRKIPDNEYQMSISHDPSTHGTKLYRLFVKDMKSFPNWDYTSQEVWKGNPPGQVMVKETWEWDTVYQKDGTPPQGISLYNDRYLVPRERSTLFIMYKTDNKAYKTDEGWIYGIYATKEEKVLEAGVIKSCKSCHEKRPDRTFGINF